MGSEAGLAVYEGKALINSMTGEDDRMEAILPLVKKYDAAIIALPNDETGIPMTAPERMLIVDKIVAATEKAGVSLENLLIDPLAMTVGADPEAVKNTLETIHQIKEKYDLNMSIGAQMCPSVYLIDTLKCSLLANGYRSRFNLGHHGCANSRGS